MVKIAEEYESSQTASNTPWMTLNYYKFELSRNFALFRIFGRQQRL